MYNLIKNTFIHSILLSIAILYFLGNCTGATYKTVQKLIQDLHGPQVNFAPGPADKPCNRPWVNICHLIVALCVVGKCDRNRARSAQSCTWHSAAHIYLPLLMHSTVTLNGTSANYLKSSNETAAIMSLATTLCGDSQYGRTATMQTRIKKLIICIAWFFQVKHRCMLCRWCCFPHWESRFKD